MSSALGTLRLENCRKPFDLGAAALSEPVKAQLQAMLDRNMDTEGMQLADALQSDDEELFLRYLELVDVVEVATGTVVADLFLYPFGDGAVVHHGTLKMIADICQHSITPHESTTRYWLADLGKAWKEGAARLGVNDPGHFSFTAEQLALDED